VKYVLPARILRFGCSTHLALLRLTRSSMAAPDRVTHVSPLVRPSKDSGRRMHVDIRPGILRLASNAQHTHHIIPNEHHLRAHSLYLVQLFQHVSDSDDSIQSRPNLSTNPSIRIGSNHPSLLWLFPNLIQP